MKRYLIRTFSYLAQFSVENYLKGAFGITVALLQIRACQNQALAKSGSKLNYVTKVEACLSIDIKYKKKDSWIKCLTAFDDRQAIT